jgi:3-oxoacyl-[acyl-carrier protein] reductase
MKINLTGQVAVVTGATSELGRVIARTLAGCGARVALHYYSSDELAKKIRTELPGSEIFQADITKPESVAQLRDAVQAQLGVANIIVTNAVVQYKWTSVLEQSIDDYRSQFESCVLQNVAMAQCFVPGMIAQKRGRVIALNSECAMQNHASQSAYVAGKRGMDGVLRVLAREVGQHGITVNQVAPGWTVSENRPAAGRPDWYVNGVPLKRWGTDQEIANAVAFLASDLAAYITGVYLPVCGGNVMPTI